MRIRHLTIRKEQFNAILSGEKTQYVKEIRPAAKNIFCEYDSNGELIGPQHFDALKLAFSQMPDKEWIEIEVKGAVIEQNTVIFELGEILNKKTTLRKRQLENV